MLNSSTGWYQNLLDYDEEAAPTWHTDDEAVTRRRRNRKFRNGGNWGPFGSLLSGHKRIARSTGKEYIFVLCCCAAMAIVLIGFSGVIFEKSGEPLPLSRISPEAVSQKMEVDSSSTVLSIPIKRRSRDEARHLLGASKTEDGAESAEVDNLERQEDKKIDEVEKSEENEKEEYQKPSGGEENGDENGQNGDENGQNGDESGQNGDENGQNGDENGENAEENGENGDVDHPTGKDDSTESILTVYNRRATEYFVDVAVGSEQQQFKLLIDTGSSNFWLPSAGCGSLCEGHPMYQHEESSTYEEDGRKFEINYGEGHVEGFFSRDSVRVGGMEVANVTIGEMTISTDSGTPFNETVWDGVVGLAFPSISVSQQPPLFSTLLEQNLLKEPIFAMKLPRETDGELTLGGYNPDNFNGEIKWFNVTHPEQPAFWTLALEKVEVTFRTEVITVVAEFNTNSSAVVIDSGTSYLTGPSVDVARLANTVGAEKVDDNQPLSDGVYFLPCNKTKDLPNIEFTLAGGNSFQLTPEEYVVPQEKNPQDPTCVFAFLPLDVPKANPDWILGDIFMHKYYTIFDFGTEERPPRVGLATASQN